MIIKKFDVIGERYPIEILELLGKSRQTTLYKGEICGTDLCVVVKTGPETLRKEYEILSKLRHPGIVRALELGELTDGLYIVMPYYEGMTLEEFVVMHGPMREKQVYAIAKSLCEILIFLNKRERPILHNDIKPSNILMQEDGRIILLDFGLACYKGEVHKGVLFQGSLGYAAPECWHQRQKEVAQSADLFSVGATIYRLLTGEKPSLHYGKFWLPDGEMKTRWQPIINKCCTLEAKYRFRNAAQLLDLLTDMDLNSIRNVVD